MDERTDLDRLFAELDTCTAPIPFDFLADWMGRTPCDLAVVEDFIRFHPDHYLRNLMRTGPCYQALILCWRPGQRSPIHDHLGSSCAVRILRGMATETLFERTEEGHVYPVESRFLREGAALASGSDDIHQISNLQPDSQDLVTLHVYSPALLTMNVYSLLDESVSQFHDPINLEFVGGAGI